MTDLTELALSIDNANQSHYFQAVSPDLELLKLTGFVTVLT